MDKFNNSQLLMCEKEDLIKYIKELKDYKDAADALENQLIEDLNISEEACKYPLDPYEAILFHVQGNHQDYCDLKGSADFLYKKSKELEKENKKLKEGWTILNQFFATDDFDAQQIVNYVGGYHDMEDKRN
jgi:hypothetical protein